MHGRWEIAKRKTTTVRSHGMYLPLTGVGIVILSERKLLAYPQKRIMKWLESCQPYAVYHDVSICLDATVILTAKGYIALTSRGLTCWKSREARMAVKPAAKAFRRPKVVRPAANRKCLQFLKGPRNQQDDGAEPPALSHELTGLESILKFFE